MLKLILFLVLRLIVCQAKVAMLDIEMPPGFDQMVARIGTTKKTYCDADRVIMHCFSHDQPYTIGTFNGNVAAIVYKSTVCAEDPGKEAEVISYLLMDKCEDNKDFHVSGNGNEVEAYFEFAGKWKFCRVNSKRCLYKKTASIGNLSWTLKAQEAEEIPLETFDTEEDVLIEDATDSDDIEVSQEIGISDSDDDDGDDDGANKVSLWRLPKNQPKIYCEKLNYECLSCSSVRLCVPDKQDPRRFIESKRDDCDTLHPYCNYTLGMCGSSPDPECWNPANIDVASNFYCMKDGWFPDPKVCSRFYICKDNVAYLHSCPRSPVPHYNPRLRMCVNNKAVCTDVKSSNQCTLQENFGRKVPVKGTNNYFMYCGMNKNVLAVDKCIGSYYYDPVEQMCRFKCPFMGNFMSTDVCTKYIRCSPRPEGGFKMTYVECPYGTGFLEAEYMCVARNRVPNCIKSFTDLYSK